MAIFSVFHLWAFPWKVYDIRRSAIVASESAPGFMPDPKTAYQGGRFGERALMDAFNPWDLVKAIGRSFRWAAVGRRRRMEDISYKSTRQVTGLEPTRNQFTAFENTDNSYHHHHSHSQEYYDGASHLQNTSYNYRTHSNEEDDARLLAHAQPNPTSTNSNIYPRPMDRAPPRDPALASSTGDLGTADVHDPYSRAKSPYQDPSGHLAPSNYGVASSTPERGSLESQETSYHSPSSAASKKGERKVTPTTLPPDATPLGPPGRKSAEQVEWDEWGGLTGRGEDERELGAGHGVSDNRF